MTGARIPVNSLARHIAPFSDALAQCAIEVIDSGYYVLGPGVSAFEQAFAKYCGAAHCIGVGNGTDALELALRALEVGSGDRVAVVANAAMYGTSALIACGAAPVFVDVVPETATMDPAALERALGSTDRVKAVIVTHLYGRLAAIEDIARICRRHQVVLVEDCAQAHGARLADGRRAGALGDAACFSFYPTKNLGALGDGGAVVTTSDSTAARVRSLRQYGWSAKYTNSMSGGRNSRLDELQARMLHLMLEHLDGWNSRRRDIANRYSREISNPSITVPPPAGEEYVAHLYVVNCERRAQLQTHLEAAGVQTDVHYPVPDHRQPCHAGHYDSIALPVTEAQAMSVLTLPCFPEMRDDEVAAVIAACNAF